VIPVNIQQRRIETIVCGQSNAYLLHGDNASILIDTGTAQYKEKVLQCCQNANVRLIVLTHGHFDHCQNAAYLAKRLHCPVGIGKEDVPLLEKRLKRQVFGKGIWGRFYAWASNRNIHTKEIEAMTPDIILEEGLPLAEYGIDGKIIRLPGHTEGSIGVRLSTGELFVGDAMQNLLFPAAAWCYEDAKQTEESVVRICSTGASGLYFGHGKARAGGEMKCTEF